MRIFLYTPFYPPQSQAAAVRCYWFAKTLKNAGHSVHVFSSIETEESEKMYFNPADNKQGFLKRLVFEILAGIELFFNIMFSRYDFYILSSPPFITILISHFACRIRAKKYLLDIRDIYPDVYFAQGLLKENSLPGNLIKTVTASMYRNSYGIITVTDGLVGKIKKLAPTANVELLMNGYDQDFFKPSQEKYNKFTVIFHGNMGKIQNIPTILKVAKKLINHTDIEFVFIGEGPQAELLTKCNQPNVKYLGPKSYTEIAGLISKAHIGFSARRDDEIGADAIPVKAFEYLGVEIPVLLTPKTGLVQALAPDCFFEFNNDDIELMANKILELKKESKSNRGFRNEMLSRQNSSKKILTMIP
jgi:glycosyltransferase involved in cell wall biosynthesis